MSAAKQAFADVPVLPPAPVVIAEGISTPDLLIKLRAFEEELAALVEQRKTWQAGAILRALDMVREWQGLILLDEEAARDWRIQNGKKCFELVTDQLRTYEGEEAAAVAAVIFPGSARSKV